MATEVPSALLLLLLLQSDVTSDVTPDSATLVDTSIVADGNVTSGFIFLPLFRGKFAPMPPLMALALLLAFSNASILLTAFDTLIDDDVLMKLLLLFVGPVLVAVVVVVDVVSDVRFPVVSASMSAVILTVRDSSCLFIDLYFDFSFRARRRFSTGSHSLVPIDFIVVVSTCSLWCYNTQTRALIPFVLIFLFLFWFRLVLVSK